MRRLFILLDLAVARGPGLEAALRQLAIAIARAWGVWHRSDLTWGYSLYDSTCPDLLLRDSLRKAASNLKLPPAFHDATATDLRSADLQLFLSLVKKVTGLPATSAVAGQGEAPVRALVSALQAALGSSFLRKLAEVAENSSGSGSSAEGLVLLFSPALASQPSLLSFLGVPASEAACTTQAEVEALLAKHVPAAALQRCQECCSRLAWVGMAFEGEPPVPADKPAEEQVPAASAGATATHSHGRRPRRSGSRAATPALAATSTAAAGAPALEAAVHGPEILAALQAVLAQVGAPAVACELPQLAAPDCSPSAFAALLGLPPTPQGEVGTAAGSEEQQQLEEGSVELSLDVWPGDEESLDEVLDRLPSLLLHLDPAGRRGSDDIRRVVMRRHREQQRAAQHKGRSAALPAAAGLRRSALPVPRAKGQAAVQQAQKLHAQKENRRNGSQPNTAATSMLGAPSPAKAMEALQEEEVESGAAMSLEEAAAELARRVEQLIPQDGEAGPPNPAEMALKIKHQMVDPLFAAVRRHYSQQQEQQEEGEPAPSMDHIRSVLLSRGAAPAALLKLEYVNCKEEVQQLRFQHKAVAQVLLRLHICGAGVGNGQELPQGQMPELEGLLQLVNASLQPMPKAGHEFFTTVVRQTFGAKFPGPLQRLAQELWEEEVELEFDPNAMWDLALARDIGMEVSGETPGTNQQQPSNSAAAGTGGATVSGNPQRSGSVRTNDTGGRPGPSNLGMPPPMALHRELSMREIVTSTRPSMATGAGGGSQSKFSGDNSGVHTGSGGGGNQRGATSKGLGNQHQLRLRALALGRNDSWAFAAQRQDKKPAARGTGRRPYQQVASRGAATLAKAQQQQQQQRPSGKAAPQGAGKGAAAADRAGGARPRGARPNVPDTPESHLKMLPQALQQQQQQQQQQVGSGQGSSPPIVSPPVLGLGPAEEVPNTGARPGLLSPPLHLAALRKAPPSRQLQFRGGDLLASGAPGMIPSSLPEDLEPEAQQEDEEVGGSKTSSPMAPAGPTWLVAAAQPARGPARRPAVPPFLQAQQQGMRSAAPQQQQQQQQSQPSQQLAGYSDLPAGEALDDAPSPYGLQGGLDEVPSSPQEPAAAGQGQAPRPDPDADSKAPTSALTAADVAVALRVAAQGTVVEKSRPAAVAGQQKDQPAMPSAEDEGQAAAAMEEHTAEPRQDSVLRLRGGGSGQRSGNSRKRRQQAAKDEEGEPEEAGAHQQEQQQQEAPSKEEGAAPILPPSKRAATGSAAARRKAASSQDAGTAGAAGPASASTHRTTRSRAATQEGQQEPAGGEAAPTEAEVEAAAGADTISVPSRRTTRAAAVTQATPGNGAGAADTATATPASVKPTARSADSRRNRGRAQQQQQQQQEAQQGEQQQQPAEASGTQKASAAERRRSRSRSRAAAAEQPSEQPGEPQGGSRRATRSTPLPDKALAEGGLEAGPSDEPQGQQAVSRRATRSTPLAEAAVAADSSCDVGAPATSQGQQLSEQPAAGRRGTRSTPLAEAAAVVDTGRKAGTSAAAKRPVAGRGAAGSTPLPCGPAAAADSSGAGRDARADGASTAPHGEQVSEQQAGSRQATGATPLPSGQGGTPATGSEPGMQVVKYKAEIVGRRVEVLLKDGAYHQAAIKSYHNGRHKLQYDDGTSKHYYLFKEQYHFVDSDPQPLAPALAAVEQAQHPQSQQQQQGMVPQDAGREQGDQGEAGQDQAGLEAAAAQPAEQRSRRGAVGAARRGTRQTPAKRQAAGPPDAEAAPTTRRSRLGTPAGAVAAASPAAAEEGQQPQQQPAAAEAVPGTQRKTGKKAGKRGAISTKQQRQHNAGVKRPAASASSARDQVVGDQGGQQQQQPQAAPLSGLVRLGCASCPAGKSGCSACCAAAQQALSNAGLGFLLQLGACSGQCSKLPNCCNCWKKVAFILDQPTWMKEAEAHCNDPHTVYCSTCPPCRAAASAFLVQHDVQLQGCTKCYHKPKGCKQCCGKLEGIMTQMAAYAAAHGAAGVEQQQPQQEQPAGLEEPAPAQQAPPAKAHGKQRKGGKRGRGSEQPAAQLASEAVPAQVQQEAGADAEMAAALEQPEAQQQQQQPVLQLSDEGAEGEQAQQHEAQQEQQGDEGAPDRSPVAKKPRVAASQAAGKGKTPRMPGLISRMRTQGGGSNEEEVEQRPTSSRRLGSSAQRASSTGARGSRGAAPSALQQQQQPSPYSGAYDIPGSPTESAGGSVGGVPGAQQGAAPAAGDADAAMADATGAPAASPAAPAMSTPWSSKRGSEEQPGSEEVLSQYTSRRSGGSISMSLSPGGDELDSRPNPGIAAAGAAGAAGAAQGADGEGAAGGLGAKALHVEAAAAHPAIEAEGMEVEEQAGESGLPLLSPCEESEDAAPAVAAAEPQVDVPERQAEGRTETAAAAAPAEAPAAAGALPQLSPFEGFGAAAEVDEGGAQAKAAPAGRLTEGKAAAAAAGPAPAADEASPRSADAGADGAAAADGTPASVERVPNAQPPPASLQHQQLTAQHLRRDSVDSQALLPMTQQQAAAAAAATAKSPQVSLTPRRLLYEGAPMAVTAPRWQPGLSPHLPPRPTTAAASSFASSPGGGLSYAAAPRPSGQGPPALRQQQAGSAAAGRTPLKYRPAGDAGLPLLSQDMSQGAARLLDSQSQPCPYSPSLVLQHPELTSSQLQQEFQQQQQQQLGGAALGGDAGNRLASPPPQVFPGAAAPRATTGLPRFPARGELLRHLSKRTWGSPTKDARLLVALSAKPAPQLGSKYRNVTALLLDRSANVVLALDSFSLDKEFKKAGSNQLEKMSDWAVEGCLTEAEVDLLVREWEQHCESHHDVLPALLPAMPLPLRLQRSIQLLLQGPAPLVL